MVGKEDDPASYWGAVTFQGRTAVKLQVGMIYPDSGYWIVVFGHKEIPSLKLTLSHLKMDGWNTIVSFYKVGPRWYNIGYNYHKLSYTGG